MESGQAIERNGIIMEDMTMYTDEEIEHRENIMFENLVHKMASQLNTSLRIIKELDERIVFLEERITRLEE